MSPPRTPRTVTAVALALLAIALRIAWPLADPPDGLSWSGGIWTDPSYNYLAARYALFDPAAPGVPLAVRWVFPLLTWVVEGWGRLFGITRLGTTILSVGLASVALFATAAAARRAAGARAGLLTLALAGTCVWLVFFSRILMVENLATPLLAMAAYFALGKRARELAAASALAATAAFFGKYQAVGAAGGILLFALLRRPAWRTFVALAVPAAAVGAAWAGFVFIPHGGAIVGWIRGFTSAGQQGPPILSSPVLGLEGMFRMYRNMHLLHRAPILLLAGGAFVIWTLGNGDARRRRLDDGTAVFAFWFLGGWLLNALLAYAPPRYSIPVVLPLLAAAACQFDALMHAPRVPSPRSASVRIPLLVWCFFAGVGAVRALQYWGLWFFDDLLLETRLRAGADLAWMADIVPRLRVWPNVLIGAALAVPLFAVLLLVFRRLAGAPSRAAVRVAWFGVAASLALQLAQWSHWSAIRTYRIRGITQSLDEMVGDGAVILGTFAPVLTEGTDIRPLWYPLGPGERDSDLLRRWGVTHVIVAEPAGTKLAEIEGDFPGIAERARLTHFWEVKMSGIDRLRLARLREPLPERTHRYEPTELELACEAAFDEDWVACRRHLEAHRNGGGRVTPEVLRYEAICLISVQRIDEATERLEEALAMAPDSPTVLRNLIQLADARGDGEAATAYRIRLLRLQPGDTDAARGAHRGLTGKDPRPEAAGP